MKMKTEYPFYELKHEVSTMKDVVLTIGKSYRDNPVLRYKKKKEVCEIFPKQFLEDIHLAETLFHEMLEKGSHIGVLGKTSYEWLLAYLAAMCSENVAVPMDKELPTEELCELLLYADVSCLVYDKEYADVANILKEKDIRCICMQSEQEDSFYELLQKQDRTTLWSGNPKEDDLAEIVFTSGTTGKSKGCMITHKNLAVNGMNGSCNTRLAPDYSELSVLPINHTLEIAAGIMSPFLCGATICINDSLKYLSRNLLLFKPTCMVAVPLIVETIYKNIWKEIEKAGQKTKVQIAMKVARLLYVCHIDIRRKLFHSILQPLGGNFRLFVVGGAYLDPEMIKDFETWGIDIVQGYGVTECAPVISCNTDRCKKYASVGKVENECEVKIVNGEIWVRGPMVMKGYYKDPEATAEVFEGEWLKTGDLGYLDKDNWLYITGRKKNLIILSNGENVSPEELEQKIIQIVYVKEVLVSEKAGQIQAEVFLDVEAEAEAAVKIHEDIKALNQNLPNYKKIAKVVIREQEFEKTTTRKIKRKY